MALQLYYREIGQGSPLVILHGLFGSGANWGAMAKRLAGSRRVVTVDLRNHGESPHAESMTYEEMADDLLALLDKTGVEKAALLGHSLGGKVAMGFALLHPERTEALIAVDIAPVRYGRRFDDIIRELKALPLDTLSSRKEADQQLASQIPDAGLRQFLLKNLVRQGNIFGWRVNLTAIEGNMDTLLGFPDFAPSVRYEGKACFIAGGLSSYVRPDRIPPIHRFFPNARIVTLPDAGHWPHIEQPEEFFQTVEGFLN
jgi:pimeloyl-ACP methyl ester carboxylesterase